MYVHFFNSLRSAGVPVTLREYLGFLAGLEAGVAELDMLHFYYLARCSLVKDERFFDRFDAVFAEAVEGIERDRLEAEELPSEWLEALADIYLDEEQKRRIRELGGLDALMQTLRERLREQTERHEGGSRWIGTGGASPFGNSGYHPAGVRIGGGPGRGQGRAVKVWNKREFRALDDTVELGTRNFKMALRRLRRFVREGMADELDIDATVDGTARQAGLLDVKFRPERRNGIKVLMLIDVGGSMDDHVRLCEELFSAARAEIKNLEVFHFHNCVYEAVWRDITRRRDLTHTHDLLRTYDRTWKLIVVGDAAMNPGELVEHGGSIEHWNEETGETWLKRLAAHYPALAWLNPAREDGWRWTPSTAIVQRIVKDRIYPLTLDGLTRALDGLARAK